MNSSFKWIYDDPLWLQVKGPLLDIGTRDLKHVKNTLMKFLHLTTQDKDFQFKNIDTLNSNELDIISLYSRISAYIIASTSSKIIPCTSSPSELWLTHAQTTLLLCLMATCLTLKQPYLESFQTISFKTILSEQEVETKAESILRYLDAVIGADGSLKSVKREERVCIKRHSVKHFKTKQLEQNEKKLIDVNLKDNTDSINEFYGSIKVDFANQYIGGGSLQYGMVQEQLMFVSHPQLYITMILCEKMKENQAIGLVGFKRFFKIQGYGHVAKLGPLENPKYKYNQKDSYLQQFIIAIDANYESDNQFSEELILRDLTKAYSGFSCFKHESKEIVTGNWGCGAFGGNIHLKFLTQLIAATLANKSMAYCPFGKQKELQNTYKIVKDMTISKIVRLIMNYDRVTRKEEDLKFEDYLMRFDKKKKG